MTARLAIAVAAASLLSLPPAAAKTLVFCSEGNPEALNPQIITTTTGMNASRPMFNNLVEFAPGSTKIAPGLAESWEITEDGKEYTFHLRRGVRFQSSSSFHPTREMNADDVLFSLLRQWKEDHPYHRVSGSRYDYFQDLGMGELLSSIDKARRPDGAHQADAP
jgi:dipeptide transport system substrate-binding protein